MIEARLYGGPRHGERVALEYATPSIKCPVLLPHNLLACGQLTESGQPECIAPYIETIEYRMSLIRGPVGGWVGYDYVEPASEQVRHAVAQMRQDRPASRSTRAGTPSARHAA